MNPQAISETWVYLSASPLIGLTLTLLSYQFAFWLYQCCGHRAWRLRWRDGGFVGGSGLTLHAGGLAAAQTFAGGFRIAERKCTAQCQNGGEQ